MICKECKTPITTSDVFVTDGSTNIHIRCNRDPNALRKFVDGVIHISCMSWRVPMFKFKDHE